MRRSLLLGGLVILIGVAWYFRPAPSDDALIAHWHDNRALFDQLRQMSLADHLDQSIAANDNFYLQAYPAPPPSSVIATPQAYPGPAYPGPGDEGWYDTPKRAVATLPRQGPPPVGISDQRRLEYVTLLQRIGIAAFGSEQRDSLGPHQMTVFLVAYRGEPIRQFVWTNEPLSAQKDLTNCRHIEESWYFCSLYSMD